MWQEVPPAHAVAPGRAASEVTDQASLRRSLQHHAQTRHASVRAVSHDQQSTYGAQDYLQRQSSNVPATPWSEPHAADRQAVQPQGADPYEVDPFDDPFGDQPTQRLQPPRAAAAVFGQRTTDRASGVFANTSRPPAALFELNADQQALDNVVQADAATDNAFTGFQEQTEGTPPADPGGTQFELPPLDPPFSDLTLPDEPLEDLMDVPDAESPEELPTDPDEIPQPPTDTLPPADLLPPPLEESDRPPSDLPPGDLPPSDLAPSDLEPSDVEPGELPPSDLEPRELAPGELPPSDLEPSDVQPDDFPPGALPPSDLEPLDVVPGELPPSDLEPSDLEPRDLEPSDADIQDPSSELPDEPSDLDSPFDPSDAPMVPDRGPSLDLEDLEPFQDDVEPDMPPEPQDEVPPMEDELPMPPERDLAPDIEEPDEFDFDREPDDLFQEPDRAADDEEEADRDAVPCDRKYNDRNCCREDRECVAVVDRIERRTINSISLDITPPFVVQDGTSEDEDPALIKAEKLAEIPRREWLDRRGQTIAAGYLDDFRDGHILIRSDDGGLVPIPFGELSRDDLCFVTAYWNLPAECPLPGDTYAVRDFTRMTYAWTASGQCHKPLYFENVALERYGHSAGPIEQQFWSAAHFFGSAVILPYSMGLYPPNECRYALGYYEPGDCAPWMIHAFPLSKRAALKELTFLLGFWGGVQ